MNVEIVELTPKLAAEFLSKNKINRPLNQKNLRKLEDELRRGQWIPNGEPIQIDVDDNLLDGQHRCHAVINTKIPIIVPVWRGIPTKAFQVVDTGKGRGSDDSLSILGYKNARNLSAVARKLIIWSQTGIGTKAGRQNVTNTDVVNFIKEHPELMEITKEAIKISADLGRTLAASSIGPCYYHFIQTQGEEAARNFFEELIRGSGSVMITKLRKRLSKEQLTAIKMNHQFKEALLIKVWNDWINGSKKRSLQYNPIGGESFPKIH